MDWLQPDLLFIDIKKAKNKIQLLRLTGKPNNTFELPRGTLRPCDLSPRRLTLSTDGLVKSLFAQWMLDAHSMPEDKQGEGEVNEEVWLLYGLFWCTTMTSDGEIILHSAPLNLTFWLSKFWKVQKFLVAFVSIPILH